MSLDQHLPAGEPPPIERKPILLPTLGVVAMILVTIARVDLFLAFLALTAVAFVYAMIRASEDRAYRRRCRAAAYEAQLAAADAQYQEAQRQHFEQHGFYFDPRTFALPYPPGLENTREPRSGWSIAATVIAVLFVIGGLTLIAVIVLFIVAFSQMGSNK